MATVLDAFPNGNGHWTYGKYLDGQVWRLVRGEDFSPTVSLLSVRASLAVAAMRRNMKVHCRSRKSEPDILIVQAYTPDTKEVQR